MVIVVYVFVLDVQMFGWFEPQSSKVKRTAKQVYMLLNKMQAQTGVRIVNKLNYKKIYESSKLGK